MGEPAAEHPGNALRDPVSRLRRTRYVGSDNLRPSRVRSTKARRYNGFAVTKNTLIAIAVALALASIVLSILFKGIFLVLLIPAFFAWNSSRSKDDR